MKNKPIYNRLMSFAMSIVIIIVSSLSYSIPVKANIITTGWEKFDTWATKTGLKFANIMPFALSQWGALTDGNFEQWLCNQDSFLDYWNDDYVDINEDTDEITFSPDFVSYIKQALKEYQNEQYGYQILPTVKYDQIPVSVFSNATEYRSMCELAKTYSYIGMYLPSTTESFMVADLSAYSDGTSGFYVTQYINSYVQCKLMDYTTWQDTLETYYWYEDKNDQLLPEVCKTFEDLENCINSVESFQKYPINTGALYLYNSNIHQNCFVIVSYTGSDILVFNNATSLKNYSVDKRGVFTTKDFYEDTGELTLKLDDLNNSIGDLTDLLSQFKDLIGKQEGGLTEEQLQKLLKDFLDEFFNRLGEKEDDNGGSSSSGGNSGGISSGDIKNGILDALSGYYEAILSYLDGILYEIQNLELITLTTGGSGSGDDSTDLLDWFDDVWKDPENNAQEFADKLQQPFSEIASGITKKFPFSIPWDIYGFFTILSGVEPPQTASTFSLYSESPGDTTENLQDLETTATVYSRDSNGKEHSAPYFELPIVVERFGIKEYIVVDLKDFQSISTLSRTMLALLFGVFLMKFTIRIIDLFKGGTDS